MRIISIMISLSAILGMLFPQITLAGETINANTEIKLIQKNKSDYQNLNLQKVPYRSESYQTLEVKGEDEIARELKLARRDQKQSYQQQQASLPKGQFVGNFSAYTAAADECGKSDGITASGVKVKEKRTLACPSAYSFGTKIKIEGYGIYVCEDRGGAIKGNKFDIYMKTKKQAFAFGRRNLTAEVIR